MQKALLASYPRSGNALTRVILWQCFGVSVITPGKQSTGSNPLSRFFGRAYDGAPTFSNDDFVAQTVPGGELLIGKTHGLPGSNIPAIVVVRDGRAVVRSYARFRSEVIGVDTSIKDIICLPKRSWSAHVHAWLDHEGPKLVLRYEDLVSPNDETLASIGQFIGRDRIGDFTATVEELRALRPAFVREGGNGASVEVVEREYGDLFWQHHGSAMERLGYAR